MSDGNGAEPRPTASPGRGPEEGARQDGWQGEPSLIEFPAPIEVKAMGLADEGFEALVRELVLPHIPPPGPDEVTRRESRGGKYLSVRVHFTATGKAQLEAIYRALRAEPRVLFTL